ncbi:alkaline phosphatase D family protein [Streptomyces sp. NPDC002205]|uniref:alkaline phosphatase D family protein n=1 Tax=Streptomyces sp. NPDC002205 TaxID=3154411 RepID=UPI003330FA74
MGPDKIVNLDQWDGYAGARDRILDFIAKERPSNPVVLGGDWHTPVSLTPTLRNWDPDTYPSDTPVASTDD